MLFRGRKVDSSNNYKVGMQFREILLNDDHSLDHAIIYEEAREYFAAIDISATSERIFVTTPCHFLHRTEQVCKNAKNLEYR